MCKELERVSKRRRRRKYQIQEENLQKEWNGSDREVDPNLTSRTLIIKQMRFFTNDVQ